MENLKVIKRDGSLVKFNEVKIKEAIIKAMKETDSVDDVVAYNIAKSIGVRNQFKGSIHIEKIQDQVEESLIHANLSDIAKSYIIYREIRRKFRDRKSKTFQDMEDIFNQKSEEVRNNANKAGDKIQTYRAMISDVACNNYADEYIIPKRILKEHGKKIYIHDKSYMPIPFFNCILVNWRDMLDNGFNMSGTKIETPKSLTTAVALLSQVISHTSSNSFGGNTIANIDLGLEQYTKKSYEKHLKKAKKWIADKEKQDQYAWECLEEEVYNSMQGLEYEISTLMNSRGEQPFLTVTLGLGQGKWCRLLQKAYLETRYKGFTDGTTPVFPKICFFLKRGLNLNEGDESYDIFKLAVKCSSVRMYPDYLNYDKLVENTGDAKSPMSCRSFLSTYTDENGKIITDSRFNQGVVSVNLVRLGILADKNEEKFYELLLEALDLSTDALMLRHKMLKTVKAKQAPILYMEGAVARLNPEDSIEPLLYNNFSSISIGYIGLHNTMIALYGESYFENEEMMKKGQDVLQFMKNYCDKKKKETTIGFSLYSTPFEVGSTKLCKQDTKDFGFIEGVNNLGYYENSFHYPSIKDISAFEKIDIESPFPKIASGGAINYVQFGNMENNLEALEEVIRYAYDKVHYFGVNTRPDRCLACGYKGVINSKTETENDYVCPQCSNEDKLKMNIIIRLCGYLGSTSLRPTIDNKMKEMHTRVIHCGEEV